MKAAMKPEQVFWVGAHFGRAVKEEKAGGMCFATTEELMACTVLFHPELAEYNLFERQEKP